MKHLLLIILFVVAYVAARPQRKGRIYGGQDASSGQFPFAVALNDGFGLFCGGVIVGPNWILTAAQCLYYGIAVPPAVVYIGSHLNSVDGTGYGISEQFIHESFNGWTYQNDIALIKIDGLLTYSDTVQPIEFGELPGPNATCTILGWGETDGHVIPENLQYVDVTAMDSETCRAVAGANLADYYLGTEQVCTLGAGGQGICSGDAGGPVVCDGKLVGITSHGIGFGCYGGMPDIHTRPGAYADWIQTHIQG